MSATPWQSDCAEAFIAPAAAVASAPVLTEPPTEITPGDANSDGLVDFQDYQKFADNFLKEGVWADGDFNLDSFVDGADYVIWADNLTLGPPPATAEAAAVPAAALIPVVATNEDSTGDVTLLAVLTETEEPAIQEAPTNAPDSDLRKVSIPLNGNDDSFPPAVDVPDAAETETDSLDPSSLIQSAESLQMVAVSQAWDLASNDGSSCAKTRNRTL